MAVIAVIPAAGIGHRMGEEIPKQYLPLLGQSILEHSVYALLADPRIERVYVALQANDPYFTELTLASDSRVEPVVGGVTRAESVSNALAVAVKRYSVDTLVAVHDAARPGLSKPLLKKLLNIAEAHPERGALAAVPAWDTIKRRQQNNEQLTTVERTELWHAFTPQVFQLGPLLYAFQQAAEKGLVVTDEASAMEGEGVSPVLVEAEQQLRKITCPDDLIMVKALMLASQPLTTLE